MQNRRIPADDKRGMEEFLDEKDGDQGIKVSATYFVNLTFGQQSDAQRRV